MTSPKDRCRLVLINPATENWERTAGQISEALSGGDVASLILWQSELPEADFQHLCETAVPAAQAAGAAAVIAGDSRMVGRTGADGFHAEGTGELADRTDANKSDTIIGAGGARTRHDALQMGEMRPDYIFFGRFGYDNKPDAHPRNLSLGEWWAELVEIPCIVLAGSTIESVIPVAACGVEFVAVSTAIFTGPLSPAAAVAEANRLLDDRAPDLENSN